MVSGECRREIVRVLRSLSKSESCSTICLICEAVAPDRDCPMDCEPEDRLVEVAHDLAGLIDTKPERMCKRVKVYSFRFPLTVWYMGCSKCKHPLDVLDLYCKNCGAKVMDDAF